MQPPELLALRNQWRRISNDARAEFKLLTDRSAEHSGSFSTTPVHTNKVVALSYRVWFFACLILSHVRRVLLCGSCGVTFRCCSCLPWSAQISIMIQHPPPHRLLSRQTCLGDDQNHHLLLISLFHSLHRPQLFRLAAAICRFEASSCWKTTMTERLSP
jgi:hypothetical protein